MLANCGFAVPFEAKVKKSMPNKHHQKSAVTPFFGCELLGFQWAIGFLFERRFFCLF